VVLIYNYKGLCMATTIEPQPGCDTECNIPISEVSAVCNSSTYTLNPTRPSDTTEQIHLPQIDSSVPNIDIPTVTEERVDGDGIFDIYMRAGMSQLDTQYQAGRIKGSDYAQAYIATIQLMMTEANKFAIESTQAKIAAEMFKVQYTNSLYQALTAEEQVRKLIAERKLADVQLQEAIANGAIDRALKDKQILKTDAEKDLICQQKAELRANGAAERALKLAQKDVQIKTTDLYKRQIKGFDEKFQTDMIKSILDAWQVQGVEFPEVDEISNVVPLRGGDNLKSRFSKTMNEIFDIAGLEKCES
jgi:hypothetical protein